MILFQSIMIMSLRNEITLMASSTECVRADPEHLTNVRMAKYKSSGYYLHSNNRGNNAKTKRLGTRTLF